MMIFLTLLLTLSFVALILVASIRPVRSHFSIFELERRAKIVNDSARTELRREKLLSDILSLQRVIVALFLVLFIALSIVVFGWFIGLILSIVLALEYGTIARIPFVSTWTNTQYKRHEQHLLGFVEKFSDIIRLIRTPDSPRPSVTVSSKQELEHIVSKSNDILSADERKLIINGLGFDVRQVHEIMTPRSVIDSVSVKEHLGPLVLNDLHKTGHSRFPVTEGDIGHIVGILHIQDLLTIDAKRRSSSVAKAMEPRVFYINENQTLQHALAAFLRTRHHLFVVVNEFRETVGLLSLEDVIEALLGRKIIDEFDAHEDLRLVASRNARANNRSEASTDV